MSSLEFGRIRCFRKELGEIWEACREELEVSHGGTEGTERRWMGKSEGSHGGTEGTERRGWDG